MCILLLCLYSQLYAQTGFDSHFHPHHLTKAELVRKGAAHGSVSALPNSESFDRKVASSDPEKGFKVEATDITEEDYAFISSQRFFWYKNYLTAAFLALVLAYFFRHIKIGLLFCKHFSYSLSHKRYLLFEVFRT
ncbi:hypothetical protein [Pontibacter litorisediminis]|uniref:hypothetical protein n=1 Tax=Pontibacter litorisediminis TaxID=1846260 RepID=UPI0023ED7F21|nr:hypothetical protein [Pontibacter litorisediminis]